MNERFACLLIGYLLGSFLTAELVARVKLRTHAFNVGTGNPGMANIGALLGTRWALVVLMGDAAKTVAACLLASCVIAPDLGRLAILYAGLGAVLGHDFPLWTRFRGGKGVAVMCVLVVLFDPVQGGLALAGGLAIVAVSKYLCYGAVAIPAIFCVCAGVSHGFGEILAVSLALLFLAVLKHGVPCWRAMHHREPRASLFDHRKP